MRCWPVLAAAVLAAAPALAGPFAHVGDRQLRQDVELLAAAGLIEGPVASWPMPWAQIDEGLQRARDGRSLDAHVAAAAARLNRLADLAAQRISVDVRVAATNDVSVARDFGTLARGQFDGSGRVEFNGEVVSLALGAGLRTGDSFSGGRYVHAEPSELAIRLGGWALYAGQVEQWFGPGQDAALLWSNSARPFPKVGIKRLVPRPINAPVLRWLGPTQLEIFGGILDGPRADFRNVLAVGTRLSFMPARGLTIGLNRAQMLCGRGRPCGARQILNSFVGFGNADNSPAGDQEAFLAQAGNQIAGWDIGYVQRIGRVTAHLYVEAAAEDFDNVILEQYSRMVGTRLAGPLGTRGAAWMTALEYADTQAAALFNGVPGLERLTGGETIYPFSMYNNSLYTGGFTYRGRPIGHWTDGDSRNLALTAAVTDSRNRRWYAVARSVHLNFNNLGNPPRPFILPDGTRSAPVSYRVSLNAERMAVLAAGAELPTRIGDLRVEGRWQSDSPGTSGRRTPRAAIEVQFRQRF